MSNNDVLVAMIGFIGVVIGSLSTIAWNVVAHCLKERSESKKNEPRKKLLETMLKDTRFPWRRLDTLMHVIGADEEITKRLLLELGARGSEDQQDLWGLVSRNPFKEQQ